jgi:hypothetical protein
MLLSLTIGLPVMLLCLLLQALMVAYTVRLYVPYRNNFSEPSVNATMRILSLVMLLMLLANFLQMGVWAALFRLLGEFEDFTQALYFSGVTFATLGYGDVVLSPKWQMLSPLEAANGVLMFGVSTAMMTGAVSDAIKRYARHHSEK